MKPLKALLPPVGRSVVVVGYRVRGGAVSASEVGQDRFLLAGRRGLRPRSIWLRGGRVRCHGREEVLQFGNGDRFTDHHLNAGMTVGSPRHPITSGGYAGSRHDLDQSSEFVHRHSRCADQRPQRSRSYLAMLGNRQARRMSRLDEDHVASALAVLDPACLLKSSHRPLPRDGGQRCHLRRNLNLAHFDRQRHALGRARFEATGDGLAYVI